MASDRGRLQAKEDLEGEKVGDASRTLASSCTSPACWNRSEMQVRFQVEVDEVNTAMQQCYSAIANLGRVLQDRAPSLQPQYNELEMRLEVLTAALRQEIAVCEIGQHSTNHKRILILARRRHDANYWKRLFGYTRFNDDEARYIAKEEDLHETCPNDWELIRIEGWQASPLAYNRVLVNHFPDWLDSCEFNYSDSLQTYELVNGSEERRAAWEELRSRFSQAHPPSDRRSWMEEMHPNYRVYLSGISWAAT